MHERYSTRSGARLFAVEAGEGLPYVMLHGGLSNRSGALRLLGGELPGVRLIAPDVRASGKSWTNGPLSWGELADDLVGWLDELHIPRCAVGGVSMGTGVVLASALRHPERVSAVVLVHPVFPGQDTPMAPASSAAMEAIARVGVRAPTEGVQVLAELYRTLPAELRARALAQLPELDPASVAATAAFLGSMAQPFERAEELRRITCPALIIPGVDPSHPAELANLYAAHLPQAVVSPVSLAELPEVVGRFVKERGLEST